MELLTIKNCNKMRIKKAQGGRTVNTQRTKGSDPLSTYSPKVKRGSGNLIPVGAKKNPVTGKPLSAPKKAKKGGSFPDLNKDGKITKADILKGRGVIKNGGKLKKARGGATLSPSKTSTSNRLASYGRPLGKNLTGKLKTGGKVKKAMGGMKMMKMGGKCRGGCY